MIMLPAAPNIVGLPAIVLADANISQADTSS
jgi:hypothetical protein